MMGRVSVWPGWPVDPRRSAGPAPHRPPRGAISRTRAPGSTRPGDRLTPGASPPSHQPTNRRTCLRRPVPLRKARLPLITSLARARTWKTHLYVPTDIVTHATAPPRIRMRRKLVVLVRVVIRLRKRIHTFLRSRSLRRRTGNVFWHHRHPDYFRPAR